MTSPESGKNTDASSTSDTKSEAQQHDANNADAIKREVQQSLFMDSIDPRFRLPPSYTPEPEAFPQAPKIPATSDEKASEGTPSESQRNSSGNPLPSKIFKENEDERLTQEYISRRPADQLYQGPRIGVDKSLQINDSFTQQDQRMTDRAEDFIYPGFGRFQGKSLGPFTGFEDWRLDYLYGKPCRIKGPSLCFSIRVH